MDKKIIDYCILGDKEIKTLMKLVNEAIKDGWQPQGGTTSNQIYIFQAMVKYEGDK